MLKDAESSTTDRTKKHSPYFPVAVSETPELEKIAARVGLVFIIMSITCNYLLAFFAKEIADTPLGATIIRFITSLEPARLRFAALQSYDSTSGFGYVFILLAGFFFGILWGVLKAALYFRFVLAPGRAANLDMRAAQGYFLYTLFLGVIIWALYFKNTELRDVLDIILLWPFFPAIAIFGEMALGWITFTTIGGAAKLLRQER